LERHDSGENGKGREDTDELFHKPLPHKPTTQVAYTAKIQNRPA
jgi:hypothetical protein